jgi:hypothetical protein
MLESFSIRDLYFHEHVSRRQRRVDIAEYNNCIKPYLNPRFFMNRKSSKYVLKFMRDAI